MTPPSPQPPTQTQNPFLGMGDETLREHEAIFARSENESLARDEESVCTQPPEITPAPTNNQTSKRVKVTQQLMQRACKRKRLSSSGTKPQLSKRLQEVGVTSNEEIERLALLFQKEGADDDAVQNSKQKAPNWTRAAPLCHVIADPRHATVVGRLYNKSDNRAELDAGRHDPWSNEFIDLFNNPDYDPIIPDGCNGVTDELLFSFNPGDTPHKRNGTFLKQRWNKMRSKYSVALEKFSKSGQGEHDTFDLFTDGDDTIAYMHCVFYNKPTLEAIVRGLPDGAGFEEGLEEVDKARGSAQPDKRTKPKKGTEGALNKGLADIAKSLTAPIQIALGRNSENTLPRSAKFEDFDISDRVASTVEKLMVLEANIMAKHRSAMEEGDTACSEVLQTRAEQVRKRIDKALMME